MRRNTGYGAVLVCLSVLGGGGTAGAIAPPQIREPRAAPPPPPRYATQYQSVGPWLDACVQAPRNGLNPQLDPPTPAVLFAGLTELQDLARGAGTAAPRDRRRCAAWVLSRHVEPTRLHSFWASVLQSSLDEQVRWEALYSLQTLHRADDLPLVMRQFAEAPRLRNALGSWLRSWSSRITVPCLAAIVLAEQGHVAENAARTLSSMPGVPALPEEYPQERGMHEHTPGSLAIPYARWWRGRGVREFAQEQAQWEGILERARTGLTLDPAWVNP